MHKFPITWQEVLAIFGFAGLAHTLVTKLGAGNFLQVLIPVGILVAGCIVRAQCNLWAASEFRFKPVKFKKGTGTLDCILKAEDSIFVTHFVGDVPNDSYIAAMKGKMDEGVHLTRVVPADIDRDAERNQWLNQFNGQERYTELVAGSYKLPFDIWIVDGVHTIICFPVTADATMVRRGYSFANGKLAQHIRTSLNRDSTQVPKVTTNADTENAA